MEIKRQGYDILDNKKPFVNTAGLAYDNNYFGGNFRPDDTSGLFSQTIPLAGNKDNLKSARSARMLEDFVRILRILNAPILISGFLLSIYSLNVNRGIVNYSLIALYLIIFAMMVYRFLSHARTHGSVINSATGAGVDLAVVRAISETSGKLEKTAVTNSKGKYTMALPKGFYKIIAAKSGLKQSINKTLRVVSGFRPTILKLTMFEIERTANINQTRIEPPNNVAQPTKRQGYPVAKRNESRIFADASEIIEKFNKPPKAEISAHPNWRF